MTTNHTIPPIAGEETMGTREREIMDALDGAPYLGAKHKRMAFAQWLEDNADLLYAAARLEGEEVLAEGWLCEYEWIQADNGSSFFVHPTGSEKRGDAPVALVRRSEGG